MRKILFFLIACYALFSSCEKEKALTPEIEYEHLYKIVDDPNDPMKHRIYEIYQKYNVPVYFNDTIGQVMVAKDVTGKPVFKYEKLDLSWGFNYYGNFKYDFEYMTDPVEKNKALDIIERYLEKADRALYPFCFFVTKSATRYNADKVLEDYKNGKFEIGFRTLFLTGNWTVALQKSLPDDMMRQMVANKIMNYPDEIEAFGKISKQEWYGGKAWSSLTSAPAGWTCDALNDNYWKGPSLTPAAWEAERVPARAIVGKLGFVWGHKSTSLQTPEDVTRDLAGYINQMLKYSPEEFEQLWGANPLVIQKYRIVNDIVVNKLGVQL
ncbi:hypothetical protein SAMN05660841_03237 [Sphingobacterium nematocida]|uniref:Uncharacterized protein n=1 Tax=Sphingobacterium nematocida TaxID=1513896 RepID=A0A1T5FH46_9SPHI|nr:hypothetical protein [Sphingobacterium nematocida]SKB95418.1 hypothetical protein SAMN05660841_03237 [Sphingobacterium nematocida]